MARRSSRRSSRSSRKPQEASLRLFGLPEVAAGGFMLLALLLGGASAGGFAGHALIQFAAALIIVWAIVTMDWLPEQRGERRPLLFALVFVGLMLAQLIPLPPGLWTALPGRAPVAAGLTQLGINPLPWMPLSLDPERTLAGAAAMLPPIAALLVVLRFGRTAAFGALWAMFAVAALSVLVGMGQLTSGRDSMLYFYEITNRGNAVGFFSNSNHLATLMLIVIPMIAAVGVRSRIRSAENEGEATVIWVAAPAVALMALLGLLIAGSVAGLALGPIALAGAYLIFSRVLPRRARAWLLISGLAIVAAAVFVVATSPSMLDFGQTSFGGDGMSRGYMWSTGAEALRQLLPFGGGYGSFEDVFRQIENAATVDYVYANHVHSDLLETLIEGGVASALLLLGFLAWFIHRCWTIWFKASPRDPIACAASIAAALVMLHSLVDYPLRTPAIAVSFALCLGLMARPPRSATAGLAAETPSARHLSVV